MRVPKRVLGGRICAFLIALAGAGGMVSHAAPKTIEPPPTPKERAAFQVFLEASLPPGSPLLADSPLTRSQLRRTTRLEHARSLKFFEGYHLIKVTYWSPTAGAPGLVLEDLRILWNRKRGRFVLGSRKWMTAQRKKHPLDLNKLDDIAMAAYIREIFVVLPWVDRWVPRIRKLERIRPHRVRISLEETARQDSRRSLVLDQIQFRPNGDVRVSRYLDRERGPDP